ncbi:MAG TPA: carboxypeptidase-like regulatory domain-containing protein [Terriglobales bacterium]|nr:carboxypeptidase-like regulatory domain-containing protein [Terriglobales bacterium]
MSKLFVRFLAVSWLACALSAMLLAQSSGTGAISGVVTDTSGAVVPDVQITVTNQQTGDTRNLRSTSTGSFTASSLPPGKYRVEASKSGFRTLTVSQLAVDVANIVPLNIKLEVGAASQTVTVEANAEQLQLETASLGHVTTGELVQTLPLVTRNYTEVIGLNPGINIEVTNAGELGRGSGGNPGGNGIVSAAGTSGMDNNFQMNGIAVDDFQESGQFSGGIPIPNPDTIQEFKVQTAAYDASVGRDAGANVNVVTRTGQNAYHGSLFEFFRNENMNANDYFRKQAKQGRPELRQNQFGFTLGGRIIRDKLFFFTSYQGTRQKNGLDFRCSSTFFEPPFTNDRSAAALGALFAGQPTFWQEQGLDVATGLPGTTVAPDGSNISPQALALLNLKLPNGQFLVPTPQTIDPSKPFAQQGFSSISDPCPFNEDQGMLNLDYNQSDKVKWEFRAFRVNSNEQFTLNVPQLVGSAVPGFPTNVPNKFRDFSITNEYIVSSKLLNQIVIGLHQDLTATNQAQPFQWSTLGSTVPSFDMLPQIGILGSIGIGGNGQTINFGQNTYQIEDNVSWSRGRHNIRFGAGGERYDDNIKSFNFLSGAVFGTWSDVLLGQSAGFGPGQNGTLLSNVFLSFDLPGELARHFRAYDWNAYVQDDIHVNSRFTLNLGFRLERLGDVGEYTGRNANFDIAAANPNPGAAGSLQGFIVADNFPAPLPPGVVSSGNNLAIKGIGQNTINPRVGFAWQVPGSNNVVLRAGYGVYHQRLSGQPFVQTLTNQPWSLIRDNSGLDNGSASFASPFAPLTTTFPTFSPYTVDTTLGGESLSQNFRPPMIQHYSLNVQDQLAGNTVLEIGYLGSRGTRLLNGTLPNEALTASPSNPIRGETTNSFMNVPLRVPVQGLSTQSFIDLESSGQSWYNALEASLTQRTRWGLQLQASYTWSKSLSDTLFSASGPNGGAQTGDQLDRHHDYGWDPFIRPQRFVLSFSYQLPYFNDRGRSLLGEALGGWGLAGVYTIQSGQHLPVFNTNTFNINGINGQDADFAQIVPGCNTATSGSIEKRVNNYINQSCFVDYPAIAPDGTTGFGNSRPGVFVGPGQNNLDLALMKRFGIKTWTEASNLEFRAEAFNALNHPQFSNPGNDQDSPTTFGVITSTAVNPRVLQLALKFNF